LQNSLLDKVVSRRTVLESVINFILKLSALQLFFRSLKSGGNFIIFEDVPVDQVLLLWPVADSLIQLVDRIRVKGRPSNWLRFFSGRVRHDSRDKVSECGRGARKMKVDKGFSAETCDQLPFQWISRPPARARRPLSLSAVPPQPPRWHSPSSLPASLSGRFPPFPSPP